MSIDSELQKKRRQTLDEESWLLNTLRNIGFALLAFKVLFGALLFVGLFAYIIYCALFR